MIKFFRTIRLNMLSEGKTGKYLTYALGEIVLVVIGILIALQLNNWNNHRQQRITEIKYLNEIKANLTQDLSDIGFNIAFNKSKLQSNQIVLAYLNGDINALDSLNFHFSNLLFSTRTLSNMSAYENLKSRGLEIITNDSLRQGITKLYEFHFSNAIDFETKNDHPFQYQILMPAVTKVLNIKEFNTTLGYPNGLAEPVDTKLLSDNYSFINVLILNKALRELMVLTYQDLQRKVKECIDHIDKELKNK